jgi:hypothetical protein
VSAAALAVGPAAGAAAGGAVFPGVLAGPLPVARTPGLPRPGSGIPGRDRPGSGSAGDRPAWTSPAAERRKPGSHQRRERRHVRGAAVCRQVSEPGRVLCREHRRLLRVAGALPQTGPLLRTGGPARCRAARGIAVAAPAIARLTSISCASPSGRVGGGRGRERRADQVVPGVAGARERDFGERAVRAVTAQERRDVGVALGSRAPREVPGAIRRPWACRLSG